MVAQLVNNLLVSVLVVIGLVVLLAMGKVNSNVAIPIISSIAGVHIGANVSNTSNTTQNRTLGS